MYLIKSHLRGRVSVLDVGRLVERREDNGGLSGSGDENGGGAHLLPQAGCVLGYTTKDSLAHTAGAVSIACWMAHGWACRRLTFALFANARVGPYFALPVRPAPPSPKVGYKPPPPQAQRRTAWGTRAAA